MKEIKDIDSFMNWVMTVVSQLKIYGEEIKDQTVVEKVLISLSTKFDVVVAAIEETKDLASLTLDKLKGSLLPHEARIDKNKDYNVDTDFKSRVSILRDKGWGRSRSRGRGWGRRYGGKRDGRENHEHESGSNCTNLKNNQILTNQRWDVIIAINLDTMLMIAERR